MNFYFQEYCVFFITLLKPLVGLVLLVRTVIKGVIGIIRMLKPTRRREGRKSQYIMFTLRTKEIGVVAVSRMRKIPVKSSPEQIVDAMRVVVSDPKGEQYAVVTICYVHDLEIYNGTYAKCPNGGCIYYRIVVQGDIMVIDVVQREILSEE